MGYFAKSRIISLYSVIKSRQHVIMKGCSPSITNSTWKVASKQEDDLFISILKVAELVHGL